MNFKIAFVGAALMAFAGIVTVGCGGDACQTAADDMVAKLQGCPDFKTVPTTTSATTGTAPACDAAAGKLATCVAACTTGATCECLGLDKSKTCKDPMAVSKCQTACTTAK